MKFLLLMFLSSLAIINQIIIKIKVLPNISILLILTSFIACNNVSVVSQKTLAPAAELKYKIDNLLNSSDLQNSHIAIYIESISQDKILYHKNENKLFIPASNMKLFTTASALSLLGNDFRFITKIFAVGKISGDTLYGNLLVQGGGDPTFSGRFYNSNILGAFESWADSLDKCGIKVITGKLLTDNSFFDGDALAEGWDWDDLPFWYAAQSSALSLNDNCVDLRIAPADSITLPLEIAVKPDFAKTAIINNTKTVNSGTDVTLRVTRKLGSNKINVFGNYPLNEGIIEQSITVNSPSDFFIEGVTRTICKKGITVLGDFEGIAEDTLLLFINHSKQLREIIKVLNKRSHNFYAEQLLRTMGAYSDGEGSYKNGAAVVRQWAKEIGVEDDEFIMVDGSGLSRKNYITPLAIAKLLRYMVSQENFLHFYNSLPVAAVDGTLKNRMVGSLAAEAVHAKTGSMSHVRNLSGYLRGRDGKLYLFVMMMNNFSIPSAQISALQDKICTVLYDYSVSNFR